MIKFVDFYNKKKDINVNGIIHIGAHMAEEEPEYLKLVSGKDKIIWVEANPELAEKLRSYPQRNVSCALITDQDNDTKDFIITSHTQSNSVLELEDHKTIFPCVHEIGRVKMQTSTIDNLYLNDVLEKNINMLVMDIQGAELLALKGSDKCLHYFDIIYTKVNITHVYKDCALITDLDAFLGEYGFYRAETLLLDNAWGDAIYLKKSLHACMIEGEDLDRVWNMFKNKTKVLVDVGARQSKYPQGETRDREYHLFDPNVKHFEYLVNTFGNNPNVFISNIALGEKRGEVSYYLESESINPRFFGREKIITINQDTLDNYCQKMEISRIDFLRIDTEGHELKVLQGATKILDNTDCILFKYGGTYPDAGITISEVYELLFSKGFKYIYYIGKNCLLYQPTAIEHKTYSNYLALRTTWKEACQQFPNLAISCISLERSDDRRELVTGQINKLGLPYEIFDAVDGKKLDIVDEKYVEYNGERFLYNPIPKNNRNKMSYGEIGCFLSNILLARKMLATDHDYFLFLEDDNIILDPNLARQQLANIPNSSFDVCLFSASMNCQLLPKTIINKHFAYPHSKKFNRANAVLYTREGLKKILQIFEHFGICLPYDDFLEYCNVDIIIPMKFLYAIELTKFKSSIWNVYKENEQYTAISHDKPVYRGNLYSDLNSHARMGNCLFQYAFLKAQEVEKCSNIVLADKCRELALFPKIKHGIGKIENCSPVEEKTFEYNQELCDMIKSEGNYSVTGYFQSYRYFNKYDLLIKNCFQIHPDYRRIAKRFYTLYSSGKNLCGIHIRLPDTRGEQGFIYSTPTEKYLRNAIDLVQEKIGNVRFIVYSSDIQECLRLYKDVFPENTVVFNIDKNVDFAFLSFCDHNIITSGSYGWWAAYLNKNPNKIVVAMNPNFNPSVERVKNNNESDYYPSEWNVLNN